MEEKENGNKRMLIVGGPKNKITSLRQFYKRQGFKIETTSNTEKAHEKLKQRNYDVVLAIEKDISNILDWVGSSLSNFGVVAITDDPQLIQELRHYDIAFEKKDFSPKELDEKVRRQFDLKKKRENKLHPDQLVFTGDTEQLISNTYPEYLLGEDFWQNVLRQRGIAGKVSRLEFKIMSRYHYRSDSRIIETKVAVADPAKYPQLNEFSLLTLKHTRDTDLGKREAAVYLGCPQARAVKCHGYAENNHGVTVILDTEEPSLEYRLTAIHANLQKPQKRAFFGGTKAREERLRELKSDLVSKIIETIAKNNAKRSVDARRIEKVYKELAGESKPLTNLEAEKQKHSRRSETYIKDILLWYARDQLYDKQEKRFDLEYIKNYRFEIEPGLFERIKALYSRVLLDENFYFINHGDMRLQNLVLHKEPERKREIVKDFDLKGTKPDVLGWDIMELLTEHVLDLGYKEIDEGYDKFLVHFVNSYMSYAKARAAGEKDAEEKGMIASDLVKFREKFGIDESTESISSVDQIREDTRLRLKRYSFLLRQVLRLRKADTITETRFMKVNPNPYVKKKITVDDITEDAFDPSNYLGEDWAGIARFYTTQLPKMGTEIDRMLREPEIRYKLSDEDMRTLHEFYRTFENFTYVVKGKQYTANLWQNTCFETIDGKQVQKREWDVDKEIEKKG
ncbi:hypothetical protein KY316_02275 [Candidatus Woesearchaeota archaeon]|nr:hypothetical protein [Candidatus Woesearchaeota archaeon]